jgi:hypothetical protein
VSLTAATVFALAIFSPGAAKADSIPCADAGGGKYACDWWRPGNGTDAGSMVVGEDENGRPAVVGYLRQGSNWIECQERGARVTSSGNWNDWYGWTKSDPDARGYQYWGWVSALDANGGTDGGEFGLSNGGTVPLCGGKYEGVPSIEGPWETSPPGGDAPAAPSPAAYDGSLYRAGEQVMLDGQTRWCTSGFPVVIDGRVFGLTGGACGETGSSIQGVAWTPPSPWNVQADLFPTSTSPSPDPVDVLTFGTPHGLLIGYAQEVDTGGPPAVQIDGIWRKDQITQGMTVCFVGGAAGQPSCGPLERPEVKAIGNVELACTELPAQVEDAGAPVYSPAYHGISRAVGIASPMAGRMCYEPIDEVLDRLDATLATGMVSKPTGRKRFPLRSVALAAHSFSARSGLRLTVRLARSADVVVKLRRAGTAASKSSKRGLWHTVRLHGRAGRNRLHVTQIQGRHLARGHYEGRLRASVRGVRSDPVPFAFRIR